MLVFGLCYMVLARDDVTVLTTGERAAPIICAIGVSAEFASGSSTGSSAFDPPAALEVASTVL